MTQFKFLDSPNGNVHTWIMVIFRRAPGRPGRHEPAAPSRKVGVLVPLGLLASLERIAQARGITRHAAIREALAAYVMAHEAETPK